MGAYVPTMDPLDFYRRPGPMTAIDVAAHGCALDGLPDDPQTLAAAVRNMLVHRDWAPSMGVEFPPERLADQHVRPVDEIIGRLLALRDGPLADPREPADRMVAVCRHFSVLHVALLRRLGVPARARAGFGGYFGPGWTDHWITEWWDGRRWVRHDAQIGTLARQALDLDFDPADQPLGTFLTGAEAWQLCRAGRDPDEFGIFDMRGLWFVLANLLRDLAAINKVELLPWDSVGTAEGPAWQPAGDGELRELDRLAAVVCADDLADIRNEYLRAPVPRTITSFVDGVATPVDLGAFVDVPLP